MYLVASLFTVFLVTAASAQTADQIADARDRCKVIMSDSSQIPKLVRLSFHDCMGSCDGCINIDLTAPNGDVPNAGLRRIVRLLQDHWLELSGISRADFWALCGQEAVQEARSLDNGATPVPITMRYGRTDCPDGPFTTSNSDNLENFPNPRLGFDHVLAWCAKVFGLNDMECVALMGAHTLGRTDRDNSGYVGPWVTGNEQRNRLNNQYYQQLDATQIWSQEDVAPVPADPATAELALGAQRWQYRDDNRIRNRRVRPGQTPRPPPPPRIMMLNTDICLRKDIKPDSATGKAEEFLDDSVPDSPTADHVAAFADDNEFWIQEFGKVFEKMIETGLPPREEA